MSGQASRPIARRTAASATFYFYRRVPDGLRAGEAQGRGYVFQVEMAYRVLQAGFRVLEDRIILSERKRGKSKMPAPGVAEAAMAVWRLRLRARHS